MLILLNYLIIALIISGCEQPKIKADYAVYCDSIYTADSAFSIVSGLVVRNGEIIETGNIQELYEKYDFDSLVELNDCFVFPGFIDGHSHFWGYASTLSSYADLTNTNSFSEVIARMAKHDSVYNPSWLLGRGWNQNQWAVKEFPDRTVLDSLFPEKPVLLTRIDGHAILANGAALRIAGLLARDTIIAGGEIQKKGAFLTGILLDKAADYIKTFVPEPESKQMEKALVNAQMKCFSQGLTTVTDAGLDAWQVSFLDSLQKTKALKLRLHVMLNPTEENLSKYIKPGPAEYGRLQVHAIKLYADGALGSRGAKLIEPYSDQPSSNGLLVESREFLEYWCSIGYENGFQMCTHAIGDSANKLVLDVYGQLLVGNNNRRWRIEHCQVVDSSDFIKFKNYSVIPSVQACHATSDMYWAGERLGDRLENAYAYKKLLVQNGWIMNGTDFPIEDISPVQNFYSAVARKDTKGWPQEGFMIENSLSRKEALLSITRWAAQGAFAELKKGSLERGRKADFVVLSKNIMTCTEASIPDAAIVLTVLNGEPVYSSSGVVN